MRNVIFHTFTMGDVDDLDIYVAQPIWEWQQTEQGQWVMAHCRDPRYSHSPDENSWGHRVRLYGELEEQDAVFHQLKWGNK
jgi:hypothetical protein